MLDDPAPSQPARTVLRVVALVVAPLLVAAIAVGAYQLGASQSSPVSGTTGVDADVAEDLAPVADLYQRLIGEAVRVPEREALIEGAMEGMLERIDDPYAVLYDGEEFSELQNVISGGFTGVGLYLEETPEGLEILGVIDGSPAEEAGVTDDERIVTVDGQDIRNHPIDSVIERVRGEEGTTVTLGLEGDGGERQVEVTRAHIDLPTVEAEMLDDGAGYAHLLSFTRGAADDLRAELEALIDDGADGLVLDLRGNPGGLFDEAVNVASLFVDDGPVVMVKEREGAHEVFEATGRSLGDQPLVVLIDGGSASASEIVAGAVQDTGRGVLVGEPTFGKGTVQTINRISGDLGVKFTTAEYFTAAGDSIEELGVQPDEEVSGDEDQLVAAQEVLRQLVAQAPADAGR